MDNEMRHQRAERAIVFSDVCQSSRLYEVHGDVKALEIVGRAMTVMSEVVRDYDGVVLRTMGDEVFSVFSSAEQAVLAARRMHQAVREDPVLASHQVALRIGLNYGEVVQEGGDVFGDAVNLAARMATLAKEQQILTTGNTVASLPEGLRSYLRRLGRMRVKGKQEEVDLWEFIWQEDRSEVTIMPGLFLPAPSPAEVRLELRYGTQALEADARRDAVRLGRSDQNDVVVNHNLVSRSHATIEYRQGKFILRDRSTNGTYVSLESGERFFVHREEMPLHGAGRIGLGREPSADNPDCIAFICTR